MKKLFTALLLLATFCTLVACGSETDPVSTSAVTTQAPEIVDPAALLDLSIAGNELEGYTIVYAKSPFDARKASKFTTEYDFYKLIAKELAEKIYADTGVNLPIKQDTKFDETALEILVGPTNRAESDPIDELDIYKTYAKVTGSKLVIGGGYNSTKYTGNLKTSYCFASTYHAYDAVDGWLDDNRAAGITAMDIPADTDFSTSVDLITVACVGDSITEGYLSSDWNTDSYPAVLQRILWKDHLIINLGNSGRTMRDDLGNRYRGTTQHTYMKRFAAKFDYALVMLGTNDSYFDRAWPSTSDELYLTSADNLIADLTAKNDDLQVVIMNCPVYYGNENSGSPRVRALQNQLPERLTEAGVNATFFDMHAYTAEHVGRANFPDLLHPNDAGYAQMAVGVSELLTALEAGTYTYTLPEVEGVTLSDPPKRSQVAAGSENLLSADLSELYSLSGGSYASWYMAGAPYLYMDLNVFSGATITNIEMPVASVTKGSTYTVSVVKYSHPTVTETLKTYTLTAIADCSSGWLGFDGLNIEVPEGYTLAFGAASDTIVPLYVTAPTTGYYFYGCNNNTVNTGATLAFNVYGTK
ncbi:MAG: SGNH/GDSL hydrolase family protein [Clostridia bacterium]|nr:SGNH/GDSL hydrolase family protein [Clostridia bacterium]